MNKEEYLPKEKAVYRAGIELFEEGADINNLTVAEITGRAGIGKGTAYEYFSGKEEMIAKAFFYNGEIFCNQLYEGVSREKNLYDKVNFVLLEMENQVARMGCIFRLLHMLSENSSVSRWIRELLKQNSHLSALMGIKKKQTMYIKVFCHSQLQILPILFTL